jgi:hypothetical protein
MNNSECNTLWSERVYSPYVRCTHNVTVMLRSLRLFNCHEENKTKAKSEVDIKYMLHVSPSCK